MTIVLPVVHEESQRAKSNGSHKKCTVCRNPMKGHKNVIDCPKNQKGKNNTSKRKKTKKK
ncbi:hypothetical protein P5673_022505 [Acropora cervicornis]|uniref:Uncharacterized protein n=1 Tax=Acropora cervicornis TaxID=6130 RepID=A0AAD9UZQ5_ACRCE|nr:hypothetical protein P5673_022505 [Acropora cervicornis]